MSRRSSAPELEVFVKAALFVWAGPNSLVMLSWHFFFFFFIASSSENLRPAAACAAAAHEPSGWHHYDFIKEDTSAG